MKLTLPWIGPLKRKRVAIGLGVAGVVILALVVKACRPSGTDWSKEKLIIATATEGGTYAKLGKELAEILEGLDSSILAGAIAKPSAGAVD